jgi:proteasome accessory factor B
MSAKRTERLLNLTICLLAARRFLTKEQIRTAVTAYAECPTDEAFERMFERDKDELRELGIPLETGTHEALFGDEVGYRIDRGAYALPEVTFTPEELAVLGLAARAWRQASLSHAAGTALLKLRAAGVDPDESAMAGLEPRIGDDPALQPLWSAAFDGRPVSFDYRNPGADTAARRRVEPWGLGVRNGKWYLVGFDTDRQDSRVFRLSRIVGEVKATGQAGSVVVPPDVDIDAELRRMAPAQPQETAVVRVRPGSAFALRGRATRVDAGEDWETLHVGYWSAGHLAEELVSYGSSVVVESPPAVRDAVIERLRALAGVA